MPHIVFVYGTLKHGFPNSHIGLPRAVFIGNYRTVETYPLVIAGRWRTPNLLNEPGDGHQVTGEAYRVSDSVLTELDVLESVHLPKGYRRIMIEVEPMDETSQPLGQAWTYLRERAHISEIHAGPMETYPIDSGYIAPPRRWRHVSRPRMPRLKRLRKRLRRV